MKKTLYIIGVVVLLAVAIMIKFNIIKIGKNKLDDLIYKSVDNQKTCEMKKGVWSEKTCWKGFDDTEIKDSEVDKFIQEQEKLIKKTYVKINEKKFPLKGFLAIEEADEINFVFQNEKNELNTLVVPLKGKGLDEGESEKMAMIFKGDGINGSYTKDDLIAVGKVKLKIGGGDEAELFLKGTIPTIDKKKLNIEAYGNEAATGAGSTTLEIKRNKAYISGSLGTISYIQIRDLIKNHPEVKTLVLVNVPGSLNDAINMHTGKMIREAGLNTMVLKDSKISSGGVDLFSAGKERIVARGAEIGVHSWCCVNDYKANELPKNHPAHNAQLKYFKMTLGQDLGPKFYFFTLNSADFDGMHNMSLDEIKKYHLVTKFVENEK